MPISQIMSFIYAKKVLPKHQALIADLKDKIKFGITASKIKKNEANSNNNCAIKVHRQDNSKGCTYEAQQKEEKVILLPNQDSHFKSDNTQIQVSTQLKKKTF